MQPLCREDIYPKTEYEHKRPDLRRAILAKKAQRRVQVGEHCTVHFEDRDTMHYQVHEMLRAENTWEEPGALEAELEAYNPMIPQTGELSATLMLEYETPAERSKMLQKLVGFEEHLWLYIGDTAPIRADFAAGQGDEHKVSSVQYVKWRLNDEQRRLLGQEGPVVRLVIDHPHYQAQAVLSEETRRAIMHDPA